MLRTKTVITDDKPLTPGQARVAAAVAARRRKGEERWAEILRQRGWTVTPPADH